MKKRSVAILSALTVIPLTALLLLTILPLTLTSCFFNAYHAKLDSDVQSYLDFDYVNSLESFGTTSKGDVYLIEHESVFEEALPEYDSSVDFDKQIAILLVYESSLTDETYYLHSLYLSFHFILSCKFFYLFPIFSRNFINCSVNGRKTIHKDCFSPTEEQIP